MTQTIIHLSVLLFHLYKYLEAVIRSSVHNHITQHTNSSLSSWLINWKYLNLQKHCSRLVIKIIIKIIKRITSWALKALHHLQWACELNLFYVREDNLFYIAWTSRQDKGPPDCKWLLLPVAVFNTRGIANILPVSKEFDDNFL